VGAAGGTRAGEERVAAQNGTPPLLVAADRGAQITVRSLLAAGADPNLRPLGEHTALHLAARIAHFGICEDLLKAGAKQLRTRTSGVFPLHLAAEANLVLVTELLLAHGADPNAGDSEGSTALHLALRRGRDVDPKLVHALLTFGANPLQRTGARKTALDVAREARCSDAVIDDLLAFEALAVKRLHETLEAATATHVSP
jgi:ankyrin repeat protein